MCSIEYPLESYRMWFFRRLLTRIPTDIRLCQNFDCGSQCSNSTSSWFNFLQYETLTFYRMFFNLQGFCDRMHRTLYFAYFLKYRWLWLFIFVRFTRSLRQCNCDDDKIWFLFKNIDWERFIQFSWDNFSSEICSRWNCPLVEANLLKLLFL